MGGAGMSISSRVLRKSIDQIQIEAAGQGLKRTLGAGNLTFLGIGCIVGSGIYVITGNAAANFAGPAIIVSFLIAAITCAFTALCYAELASSMPVSGSAYTYAYATLGEFPAWVVGWLLILEYGVGVATVAAGFSGYFISLLRDFGVLVPPLLSHSTIQMVMTESGRAFHFVSSVNLVAALGVIGVTAVLVVGVSESVAVNNVIVCAKIGVLIAFVAIGASYVRIENWTPFIPAGEGGFAYGWSGVLRAASIVFVAYTGFDAVSTGASEARNPRRDVPIGILGSLTVSTLLYLAVATVLVGVVPFKQLGVPDPIAVAVDRMHLPWLSLLVKGGALAGLSSVMLTMTYGQSRIFFAMASDGLLPPAFCKLHATFKTPWIGTMLLGASIALATSMLPIAILADLVSLGTTSAFAITCFSVIYLRNAQPNLTRPFQVPFGGLMVRHVWVGYIPALGILSAVGLACPTLADIVLKAAHRDAIPAVILGSYIAVGAVTYQCYGARHSCLRHLRAALP
jgi:basic amino acid/polyamine antiporter, APA family